jgi:hypothetical protein
MKVGDLVKWASSTSYTSKHYTGIVLEIIEKHVKIAELSTERTGRIEWWDASRWELVSEKDTNSP